MLRQALQSSPATQPAFNYEVIVIGAGIAGLYQLHRLRELGVSVRLLEAGSGVGGVWYWNRYPGARLDSESYTYGYFFSEELQNEWSWSEEFVSQPELERYFNFVTDKFGLREDIEFNARVESASFDPECNVWRLTTACGRRTSCRFLITALGILSAPQFPNIPGLEEFEGEWHHTARWPDRPVEISGRNVAVVGTGSSGVQFIQTVAKDVSTLTVFQRTPNWCTPINNRPITPQRAAELRRSYRDLYRLLNEAPNGYKHGTNELSAFDLGLEERRAFYDELWSESGLRFFTRNFRDIITSREANDTVCEYLAEKIRERVKDPEVAEKLIPQDHGFAMKRPPLENGYYEVFNQENVTLVDTTEEPIRRFTRIGIETIRCRYQFDLIVLATGFDALTGALDRIDIRGIGGERLRDHWAEGPRTWLGLFSEQFPNLIMVNGPQGPTGNNPRTTEFQVDMVTGLLAYMRKYGYTRVEAARGTENRWTESVEAAVRGTLLAQASNWAFGSNVPGKRRASLQHIGGLRAYRETCAALAANGYEGLVFGGADAGETSETARGTAAR